MSHPNPQSTSSGNADVPVGRTPQEPGNADAPVGNSEHAALKTPPADEDVGAPVGNTPREPGNADVPVGNSEHAALKPPPADEDVGAPVGNTPREPGNADVPVGNSEHAALKPPPADEDVGAPRTPKGWYSRGYLPHRDTTLTLQSITFRLADSLPQDRLDQLKAQLAHVEAVEREQTRRTKIEAWLDAGMGCCALRHPDVANYVQDAFLHFHGEHYVLAAWCILPNHVHVLIQPRRPLGQIVQGWKSFTARWMLDQNEHLGLGLSTGRHVWMREYWDRYIRNPTHRDQVVDYIHQNPVKAGLCRTPEDWPWSSASPGNADVPVGPTPQKPWKRRRPRRPHAAIALGAPTSPSAPRRNSPGSADVPVGPSEHAALKPPPADEDVGAPGAFHRSASKRISAGCSAVRPVPSWI